MQLNQSQGEGAVSRVAGGENKSTLHPFFGRPNPDHTYDGPQSPTFYIRSQRIAVLSAVVARPSVEGDMSNNFSISQLKSQQLPENCQVFKHSTQCPVSAAALAAVEHHNWRAPVYQVNVIEQRSLSNWISFLLNVQHESPQLIFVRNGVVTAVLNHGEIAEELASGRAR